MLSEVGIQLETRPGQTNVPRPPNLVGPAIPALPYLFLVREGTLAPAQPQMVRRGSRMVPVGNVRQPAPQQPPQPNVKIGVDERGNITEVFQNYKVQTAVPAPIAAVQYDEIAIKNSIGRFVTTGLRGLPYEAIPLTMPIDASPPTASASDAPNGQNGDSKNLGELVTPIDSSSASQPELSRPSKARSVIGQAVMQNEVTIELIGTALLAFLDDKLTNLQTELPNSDEAQADRNKEISDCSNLRNSVQRFLDAAAQFAKNLSHEPIVVDTTTSFANGLGNWWTKRHVEICDKTFDIGLFSLGASVCVLAGAGGLLAAIIPGVLVGGQPIVDTLKVWSRDKKKA